MTKADLIERVAKRKDLPRELTKKAVAQIVDAVFMEMGDFFIRSRVARKPAPAYLSALRHVREAPPQRPHRCGTRRTAIPSPSRRR